MANLKEQLMTDLQEAMRSHDALRRDVIRMVRAAIVNAEIAWQRSASDEEIVELLRKEVKRHQESIELFRQGGREDLAQQEEAELRVVESYLPRQLSEPEIREAVQRIIAGLGVQGPAAMGAVMKRAMEELRGKADGRLVNQVARDLLCK